MARRLPDATLMAIDQPRPRRQTRRPNAHGSPVLRRLARHSNARIRSAVASNPRCSHGVLKHLSEDSHDSVRRAVSSHDRCPSEVLDRLGEDPNKWVRSNVTDRSR